MNSLGFRVQPWETFRASSNNGWIFHEVHSRVELMVDGRGITELSEIDAVPENVTVFDMTESKHAAEVLMGQARLTDYYPPEGRLPLLGCPCGDPGGGVLTVRLSLTKDTVTWDKWAREDEFYPTEWLEHLPAYHFQLDEYAAIIDEARRLADEIAGKVTSMIRVANPGGGISRWIDRGVRGELACRLDWLDIEVVQPEIDERGPKLCQLVDDVKSIQTVLASHRRTRRLGLTQEQSKRVYALASRILDSDEFVWLPGQTRGSVEWLRDRFQGGN